MDVANSGNSYTVQLDGTYLSQAALACCAQLATPNHFKAMQTIAALGSATASKPYDSNALVFAASAYNNTSSSPEAINFAWQAEPAGNDTRAPYGTMNLLSPLEATHRRKPA